MELDAALHRRRSIRRFHPRPVPRDTLVELVDSACLAPSAGNMRAWRYVIVTEATQLRRLRTLSPGLRGHPPSVIVICEHLVEAVSHAGSNGAELGMMDAAMAAYGITLKAYSLHLGSCVVASFNKTAVRQLLELPETIAPMLMVSVGHAAIDPRPPARRKSSVVSFEVYDA